MQRFKSIWNASPFSWQGLRARWRYSAVAIIGIVVFAVALYAFRFRAAPADTETNVFANLAVQEQEYLNLIELTLRFEQLAALVTARNTDAAVRLYNRLTLSLEEGLSTERWLELEPQLDQLGSQLSRNSPDTAEAIADIISFLRQ